MIINHGEKHISKSYIMCALVAITICLTGCSKDGESGGNVDPDSAYIHEDKFIALTTGEETSEEASGIEAGTDDNNEGHPELFGHLEPVTRAFDEEYNTDDIKDKQEQLQESGNEIVAYTDSENVNVMINDIINQNGLTGGQLIDQWYDLVDCDWIYTFIFDNEVMYIIHENDDGTIYSLNADWESHYWIVEEAMGLEPETQMYHGEVGENESNDVYGEGTDDIDSPGTEVEEQETELVNEAEQSETKGN